MMMPVSSDDIGDRPLVVRIVIDGAPWKKQNMDNIEDANQILKKGFESEIWDELEKKAFITILPGGLFRLPFPSPFEFKSGWEYSNEEGFKKLTQYAESLLTRCLDQNFLVEIAFKRTEYISFGIDLYADLEEYKTQDRVLRRMHAELVAVVKINRKSIKFVGWTGKSYPVGKQEKTLFQVTDLMSHCIDIKQERILILGCHDLNMFSNRAWATQQVDSHRRQRTEEMRNVVREYNPTIVIHHPHQTDSRRIWMTGWSGVKEHIPGATMLLSGIAYYPRNNHPETRQSIEEVLNGTRFGCGIRDIIVKVHSRSTGIVQPRRHVRQPH